MTVYHSHLDLNKIIFHSLQCITQLPTLHIFYKNITLTRMAYFSKIYAILFQGLEVLLETKAMLKKKDYEMHYTAGPSQCTANRIQMLCIFTICHDLTLVTHFTSFQQL